MLHWEKSWNCSQPKSILFRGRTVPILRNTFSTVCRSPLKAVSLGRIGMLGCSPGSGWITKSHRRGGGIVGSSAILIGSMTRNVSYRHWPGRSAAADEAFDQFIWSWGGSQKRRPDAPLWVNMARRGYGKSQCHQTHTSLWENQTRSKGRGIFQTDHVSFRDTNITHTLNASLV